MAIQSLIHAMEELKLKYETVASMEDARLLAKVDYQTVTTLDPEHVKIIGKIENTEVDRHSGP